MTSLFNANDTDWNVKNECKILPQFRIEKYYKQIDDTSILNVIPDERIGSESTMGEVYKWNNIAVKILPIVNKGSYDNNAKEIELAKEVSQLVVDGTSKYFPLVYTSSFCQSTYYYDHINSDFAIKSAKFQSSDSIKSHLLFSELAHSDLKNYASKLTQEELDEVILQVFKGIRDLQIHCNIIHNDLHLGNILLLCNPKKYDIQVLIHDFGRSIKINKQFNSVQRKKDIIIFLSSIRELKMEKINSKINDVLEILDNSTSNFPIIECIKYWKNNM